MIKQLVTAFTATTVIQELFPTAKSMPSTNKSDVYIYKTDMAEPEIRAVLANWGKRSRIKVSGFEGRFDSIRECYTARNVVLAVMKNFVYVLSSEGLSPLGHALDVGAAVAEVADRHIKAVGGRGGLFSRLEIDVTETEGNAVLMWATSNPHMLNRVKVDVEDGKAVISF